MHSFPHPLLMLVSHTRNKHSKHIRHKQIIASFVILFIIIPMLAFVPYLVAFWNSYQHIKANEAELTWKTSQCLNPNTRAFAEKHGIHCDHIAHYIPSEFWRHVHIHAQHKIPSDKTMLTYGAVAIVLFWGVVYLTHSKAKIINFV